MGRKQASDPPGSWDLKIQMKIAAYCAFGLSTLLVLAWPLVLVGLFVAEPNYSLGKGGHYLHLAGGLILAC